MALAAATIFEVRSATGNDTNGGAFVEGAAGTDYSQQASKNTAGADISTTDAVANGSTTITSATANFGTTIVGNIVYFSGGTGTITGVWRQVTARASTTSITIDAAIASSTGMTMNIGGALATVQAVIGGGQLVAGMTIFAKGSETRATVLTTIATAIRVCGYTTTRLDGGKYTFTASAGMATLFNVGNVGAIVENIKLDGNGQTISAVIFNLGAGASHCRNIEITGVAGSSTVVDIRGTFRQLWVHDNTTTGSVFNNATGQIHGEELEINGNASMAIAVSITGAPVRINNFAIYNNAGDAFKFAANGCSIQISDGIIYAQGGVGINYSTGASIFFPGIEAERVIITGCTGAAIALSSSGTHKCRIRLKNCYEQGNGASSSGKYEGTLTALAGDPFVAKSSGNFALSPSGADYATLKAVGFTYPRATTVDYRSAGAAQIPVAAGANARRKAG